MTAKTTTFETDTDRHARQEQQLQDRKAERREQHRDAADDTALVMSKAQASGEGHVRRAAELVARHGDGKMPDHVYKQYLGESQAATRDFAIARGLRRELREHWKGVQVRNEPAPYGPQSPHSHFRDTWIARSPATSTQFIDRGTGASDVRLPAVHARLTQHAREARMALTSGSKWGRRIAEQVREEQREDNPRVHRENAAHARDALMTIRAFGTDGGASATAPGEAAAFVSPNFILKLFAAYRGAARTFADACDSEPLPEFGMKIYIPYFSTSSTVTELTEGSAVSESSPTTALEGAEVKEITGAVKVSQQILDRGGSPGGAIDRVIGEQLSHQLNERVDKYTISTVITAGKAVTGNSWPDPLDSVRLV